MIGHKKDLINYLLEQEDDKIFEIKEKKSKRTLTQNSYYWKLVNEIANKVNISKEEVHFDLLRNYSQREYFSCLSEVNIGQYYKYYDTKSTFIHNGKKFVSFIAYKRSSELDTKEFIKLLDGTIQECEGLGIPTLTDEEIKNMKLR